MSVHDNYLQIAHDNCQKAISEAKEAASKTIEPIAEQFQKNSLENIPQQFGTFLYTAMGDRVTGQRSSVINKSYLENNLITKQIQERADNNGLTIEEQIKKEQKEWNEQSDYDKRWHVHAQPHLWITTGRKFGVSYITGDGTRYHTIYFGAGKCFEFLTQEHVDCVKNKLKRECVQSFLNFRNDFYDGLNELNDQFIPVNVPINIGVVSCITKSPKINHKAGSWMDSTLNKYTVMDDIVSDKITHVIAKVGKIDIWDKKTDVDSREVSKTDVDFPSYISLTFVKIDDNDKTIAIIGNVDIGMNIVSSSTDVANNFGQRQIANHITHVDIDYHNMYKFLHNTPYSDYSAVEAKGVLLNMDEVLNNDVVKNELEKRVKFYNDMSDRLQRMKHENATLYFVNADM